MRVFCVFLAAVGFAVSGVSKLVSGTPAYGLLSSVPALSFALGLAEVLIACALCSARTRRFAASAGSLFLWLAAVYGVLRAAVNDLPPCGCLGTWAVLTPWIQVAFTGGLLVLLALAGPSAAILPRGRPQA